MKYDRDELIILNNLPDFGYQKLTQGSKALLAKELSRARERFNIDEEMRLIDKHGVRVITVFDAEYPASLKQISSPPIVLYARGDIESLNSDSLAVVGTRSCTYYGRNMTRRICSSLARLGIAVVSGMARGIDTIAHRETLDFGGKTIAVLGSGLNHIYPPENKRLAEEISVKGAVISEFPMNTPPFKYNFPRRNRIISALSKGVVIVEAPERSGALITADFALEQGKEIFAVPGYADSYNSAGTNLLIKDGAKLVNNASDIVEELFPHMLKPGAATKAHGDADKLLSTIDPDSRKIYEFLSDRPVDTQMLLEELELDLQQLLSGLLNLELAGLVKQLPGKLFIRAQR